MRFPLTANLDDDLKVVIHLHEFYLGDRDRQCWTYITQGMAQYGQQELSLSLLVDDGVDPESFPKTPVRMFDLLAKRIRKDGKKVQQGDATKLGQKGIFSFPCAFCVPAIQYPELPALDDTLALVLVHQNEYDYARRYSITRFLARLGRFCSSFPYPTWNTQRRPSLFVGEAEEVSLLTQKNAHAVAHSYVHQLSDVLHLQLHEDDADAALQALLSVAPDKSTILSTSFSPHCDAGLYWQAGQAAPGAYAAPEANSDMMGGSFIMVGTDSVTGFHIEEDGYSLMLNDQAISELTAALKQRKAFKCQLGKQLFVMDFLDASPQQHARLYEPVAVWRSLQAQASPTPVATEPTPNKPKPPETPVPIVRAGRFINLTGEKSLVERVDSDQLKLYLQNIEQTLLNAMSEETEAFAFDVTLTIYPDKVSVDLSHIADLNPEFLKFVEDTILKLPACPVSSQVRIRVPFSINDG